MTDDKLAAALGQQADPLRCIETARTDRGWERCHLNEHSPSLRHHVRDRSWLSWENTPRLRLGQPCSAACAWPDLVRVYRTAAARAA